MLKSNILKSVIGVVYAIILAVALMVAVPMSTSAETHDIGSNYEITDNKAIAVNNEVYEVYEDKTAGVGNSNSYSGSSGGSSHSGSSSSSSSSRSSHSSSSYRSSGSSSGPSGGFLNAIIMLIVLIVIVYTLIGNKVRNESKGNGKPIDGNNVDVSAIKQTDPNFSEERFIAWAKEVFIKLNKAWTLKDWSIIRPFESEELFNQHKEQLDEYIRNKTTNYIERLAVNNAYISDVKVDNNLEYIEVTMQTQMIDYVQHDETGKISAGDKTTLWQMVHTLKFMRTAGIETRLTEDGKLDTTSCPNCGAPTQVTSAGECEYCHTVITKGNFGWVLVDFRGYNI